MATEEVTVEVGAFVVAELWAESIGVVVTAVVVVAEVVLADVNTPGQIA